MKGSALSRPDRDLIFMEMAHVIRKRSTCSRGSVGAIAVMDQRVIATGYNGSPPRAPHCTDIGCDVDANNHAAGCQRAIHAESNLIAFAARHGVAVEGATLYCTHGPCLKCAQLILSAGFGRLVYGVSYRLPEGLELLNKMGMDWDQLAQEYVQRFETRHAAPIAKGEEQGEENLPTKLQTAEGTAYHASHGRWK